MLYRSTLAASTLIVLFSEMLEFSKEVNFKEQIMKENKELFFF